MPTLVSTTRVIFRTWWFSLLLYFNLFFVLNVIVIIYKLVIISLVKELFT